MKLVSLGMLISLIPWLIWSIFSATITELQSYYMYADYILVSMVLIECLFEIKILKIKSSTIFIGILLLLSLIFNSELEPQILATHFKYLFLFFLLSLIRVKYSYKKIWDLNWMLYPIALLYLIGWNNWERPMILYENNFELLLPILLFTPGIVFKYPNSKYVLIIIGLIVIRSGSLSVFSAYSVLVFSVSNRKLRPLLLLFSVIVFLNLISGKSGSNIMNIDRVVFAKIGFETFSEYSFLKQLISIKLMPIKSSWDNYMNFYQLDFAGINYPVSLHAFHLRTILIHGLLGAIVIYRALYESVSFHSEIRKIVFLILFVAGLSISAYNNMFVFLGVYLLTKYGKYSTS